MSIAVMPSRAAAALLLAASVPALASACQPAPLGEIVLIIKTDMAPPKDFNQLRVLVFKEGELRFKFDGPLPGDPTEENRIVLPSTLGLIAPDDPKASIRIEVGVQTGGPQGKMRVVREVVTTIPPDRVAMLHLPIQFLCKKDDIPFSDENDFGPADCPEGKTCIAGVCEDSVIPSETLPDYDAKTVFGGSGDAKDGRCFDVAKCFEQAELIDDTTFDLQDCAFPVPKSIGAANLNLALGVESDGICNGRGCFITLDAGSDTGWKLNEGQTKVLLAKGICENLAAAKPSGLKVLQIVQAETSAGCPQKTDIYQSCGPWSAVESAPPPSPVPVSIAGAQDHPISVTLVTTGASDFAYWTNSAGMTIKGASLAGGPLVSIDTDDPPRDILSTDKALFFTTSGASGQGSVYLKLAGKSAPALSLLPMGGIGTNQPEGIALFGDKIFWTEFTDPGRVFTGTLTADLGGLDASGAQVLSDQNAYPYRIVADKTYVYWTNEGTFDKADGSVARIDHTTPGATEAILTPDPLGAPRALALDLGADGAAKDLYFTTIADGTVWRIPDVSSATPGAPEKFATGLVAPNGIAVDEKNVYIADRGDGTIAYKPKTGGDVKPIAFGQKNPGTLLVKGGTLLWVNEGPSGSDAKEGSIVTLDISGL